MKNKNLISFLFFALLLLGACDFITKPYEPLPPPPPVSDSTRYILLEDFTGHDCINCPFAADTAKDIKKIYGERVIVMGVHVGTFAAPHKNDELKEDFRTEAGDIYGTDAAFGMAKQGLPQGMVNRKKYRPGANAHVLGKDKWKEEVYEEVNKRAVVKLKIENKYDATTRKLECTVKSTFFYDTLTSGPYKLVLSILQDSIIAPQSKSGIGKVLDYVHNHVLRDNINGAWGSVLVDKGATIIKSKEIERRFSYDFPAAYPNPLNPNLPLSQTPCVVENCHIVAYIYNDATKEIIQVAEEKVIQ
jgi:hypothetical protein